MAKLSYSKAIETIAESAKQEAMKFEKGDGTKDSMIEAQAQLKQAKAMLSDAEFNLLTKLKSFQILSGLSSTDWMDRHLPNVSRINFNALNKDVLWGRIEDETPELLAAVAVERINQIKARQSKYDVYPTLDAYGQSTNAQNDTTNTLGYQYRNNQVGIQLSYPLFAGGGLEATKRQAVASYEASVADRESLSIRIQNQFDGDWAAQAGFLEKAKAAESLVMSAQEQKKAALLGIKLGIRTWSDVSSAELLLARREADLNSVLANLYKFQSRILSLLPSDDPAWDEWIKQMDLASLRQ
jgi:outer membrane protein TolC